MGIAVNIEEMAMHCHAAGGVGNLNYVE